MQKKLVKEIKDLAGKILLKDDFNDIEDLHLSARELYEKITVFKFSIKDTDPVENNNKPPEIIPKEEEVPASKEVAVPNDEILHFESGITEKEDIVEEETAEKETNPLFEPKFDSVKEDMSLKKEFQDTISLDETEKLFETRRSETKQLSLHDKLLSNTIQVGLNDRIAFVNNLFNFSQSDFNKVLSYLNSCKTKNQAMRYILYEVKPRYNWKGKEDLEERLIALIERKFI